MVDLSNDAEEEEEEEEDVLVQEEDNEEGGGEGEEAGARGRRQEEQRRRRRRQQQHNHRDGQHFKTRPIDVAEILVAPVSVTYSVPCAVTNSDDPLHLMKNLSLASSLSQQQKQPSSSSAAAGAGAGAAAAADNRGEEVGDSVEVVVQKEKMAVFWVVILKTRKCYNFNKHLEIMINDLDKEEKSRVQKLAAKEFVDVMNMMREVFLFQYRNSPNVITHLKKEGVGNRIDPFQRLSEMGTPDSLDSICSVYEAYRSIVQQIDDLGTLCLFYILCVQEIE